MTLEVVTIDPKNPATSSIIWLHGLGADGHDFEDIVAPLDLPSTRFVFPHAPKRSVTLNMGMEMRAWYDIPSLDFDGKDSDRVAIGESIASVEALVDAEIQKGVPKNKILITGFSQGGAIALRVGLRQPDLCGILALSCYLLFDDDVPQAASKMPFYIMHGSQDPVVPFPLGQYATQTLKQRGYNVQFTAYPMPHALCEEQIVDMKDWLHRVL